MNWNKSHGGPHSGKNLVSLKTAREIEKKMPSEGDLPSPPAMKVKKK